MFWQSSLYFLYPYLGVSFDKSEKIMINRKLVWGLPLVETTKPPGCLILEAYFAQVKEKNYIFIFFKQQHKTSWTSLPNILYTAYQCEF